MRLDGVIAGVKRQKGAKIVDGEADQRGRDCELGCGIDADDMGDGKRRTPGG